MVEGHPFVPEAARGSKQEFDDTRAEKIFFGDLLVNRAQFESAHPFGLDVAPTSTVEKRRAQAKTILSAIRESKWGRPLLGFMAVLAGVGHLAFERMKDGEEGPSKEEVAEVAFDDPGVQYEMKRLVLEELMAKGEMTVEQEGRFGRQSWDPIRRIAYQDFPTLQSKFEYLHDEDPDIIGAYGDPRGRLDNYRALYEMMAIEFRHSSLPFQFSEQCVKDAIAVIPSLPANEALQVYNAFTPELARSVGLRAVREMALGLKEALPSQHPVMQRIEQQAFLSDTATGWLKPQKENSAYFDQVTGRVKIYHRLGDKMVLLDTFPGNGGSAQGVAWQRGLPAQVAVRTPDGEFTFSRAFEKKSASWQYSWVTDTAPLRFTSDKQNVEYQDEDGKWRRLTGEDAEFTVMGAPQKPFKEKKKSSLYNAATDRTGAESAYPSPFDLEDVVDEKGSLRSTWDLNDFGPRSIQMNDKEGNTMSIFFHSSPHDEGKQAFLNNSHGCVHLKPFDLDMMSSYLDKGSSIRISSVENTRLTQKENPSSPRL